MKQRAFIIAAVAFVILFVLSVRACIADTLYRTLQSSVIASATADTITTLSTNQWGNLYEANPIYRRSDGSASPYRVVPVKCAVVASNLYLLKLGHTYSGWKRYAVYGLVGVVSSREWVAAINNARLPHEVRR